MPQSKYLNSKSFKANLVPDSYLAALQKMPGDPEVGNLDTELTRLEVGVRQMVQDFPLCATFREIDQQNALVRGELDSMREKLVRLDTLALEQVIHFCHLTRVQKTYIYYLLMLSCRCCHCLAAGIIVSSDGEAEGRRSEATG